MKLWLRIYTDRKKYRQNLIDFYINHELKITTTFTKTHLITWKQTRISNKRIQNLQKTTSYHCIPYKYQHITGNARSYYGTTTTDELLTFKIQTRWFEIYKNGNKERQEKGKTFNMKPSECR